jgi:dTDP-4-amino-4,6-dideoxygalactose transaminase
MKKLSKRVEHKKNMFKIYRDILEKVRGIEFLETNLDEIVPWFNDIFLPSNKVRDNLIEHLNNHKIGTRIIYPPIHKLKPYSNSKTNFVNTDEMSKRGLWLPSSSFLTEDDIIFISDKIKNFMQEE